MKQESQASVKRFFPRSSEALAEASTHPRESLRWLPHASRCAATAAGPRRTSPTASDGRASRAVARTTRSGSRRRISRRSRPCAGATGPGVPALHRPAIHPAGLVHVRAAVHAHALPAPRRRAAADVDAQGRGRAVRLRDRPVSAPPPTIPEQSARTRPVVLATMAVPFEPDAVRVALGAALESRAPLIVVDAVELPLWPQSIATR